MGKGKESSGFRVIIAGGGIAGLTLANALQLANIDYVLLEGRNVIAPQVGASIGIGPSGARILDQIGCYDDINEHAAPVCFASHHYGDGSLIKPPIDTMTLVSTR
jgi:2-polyprenyl-6-methoxyphenol hydroxylase-like FAD-dependent oxidoreductase